MKKIMKKALSLMLVMAMIMVPITTNAATGTGTDSDPFVVTSTNGAGLRDTVTVKAGETANVTCSGLNGGMMGTSYALNVIGNEGFTVVANQDMGAITKNDESGVVSTTMYVAGMMSRLPNPGTFTIENTSGVESTYIIVIELPKGTMNNPDELVVNDSRLTYGTQTVLSYDAATCQGDFYYYTWQPTVDGTLTITLVDDECDEGWWYSYSCTNEETSHALEWYSSDSDVVNPIVCTLEAYNSVNFGVKTDTMNNGDVVFIADFVPSSTDDDEGGGEGDGDNEEDTTGQWLTPATLSLTENKAEIKDGECYYYEWIATEDGTLTVTGHNLLSGDGHWGFAVIVLEKDIWTDTIVSGNDEGINSYDLIVEEGDVVKVEACRPNGSNGDVVLLASFKNYVVSDQALNVGPNAVTLDANHGYTVFEFSPEEAGEYEVTTTALAVGNWGAYDWNLTNPQASTNIMTIEVGDQQSAFIGVPNDASNCTITITKKGEIEDDGPTYTTYVNKVTPEAYTFAGNEDNLIYINVTDDIEDVIVLGKDGYYHFGTENGPIVLVDLANETYSLAANVGTAEEPGPAPAKDTINMVDYTVAMQAYVAAADNTTSLYPLTEDLMAAYKNYGESQGWYGNVLGFPLFENEMDPEKAWMFACCYVYEVVEGDNATWTQGSADGLTFKANGNFAEFIGLKVDGVEVDKANYTAKEGSTIVTLSKDYLATLAVGAHTVTFVYENNGFEYTADATFTIATPVKSGDSTNIALWIAVLGLGVVAIAGSVVMRKREF